MANLNHHDVTIVFLSLGTLLALARLLGELAQRCGQPAVVGEILAGIVLGPTLLGAVSPGVQATLFPSEGPVPLVLDGLTTVAIALFLLVAGMEVELSTVWRQGRSAMTVAMAGFLIPFALGLGAALAAPYALGCEVDADPEMFALFFATAISISALPVIAKTLMDLNLYRSDLGMIVISAAVFNDLVGWIVFAIILGMIGTQARAGWGVETTILLTLLFAGFMLTVGRWLTNRMIPWIQAYTSFPGGVLGFAVATALLGAALTEWIGIHAIFGSFLVGVAIGDSRHLRPLTRETILDFVSVIFAPLFFASVGLRVDFVDKFDLTIVASVMVLACLGKILGCGLAARWTGTDWRTSWALGFAMNARGAMEIILGMLALQNGLIRQRMFVALVIMAVGTSMLSGPMIQRMLRRKKALRFLDYLPSRAFRGHLEATDRRGAIEELVELATHDNSLGAAEAVASVLQRQRIGSTGVGNGVAVPHARIAGLTATRVVAGISRDGIDFDSADGLPAHLIFLVLVPAEDTTTHLEILADIARTFHSQRVRERACNAENYTEFVAAVRTERRTSGVR